MGPWQVLPLRVRVDLGVITIKGYSTFLRYPELEPHHLMQLRVIPGTPLCMTRIFNLSNIGIGLAYFKPQRVFRPCRQQSEIILSSFYTVIVDYVFSILVRCSSLRQFLSNTLQIFFFHFQSFNQDGAIFLLNGKSLKSVGQYKLT